MITAIRLIPFRFVLAIALLVVSEAQAIGVYPVGSAVYNQNKERLLHEKQEYYLNEESFARMMRVMMTNGDAPGIFFADISVTSPTGASFALAVEWGGEIEKDWGIGLMAGMQVYVLPVQNLDAGKSAYYDEKNKGLNVFTGLDFYTPFAKIFAGVRVTDGELKSDAQIESEATGDIGGTTPLSKILRPYIFVNSSKYEFFQARLDASSDLSRLGSAALLGFLGINAGAAFDKANTIAGTQNNAALILRKGIDSSLNAFSEWLPHVEMRYGVLTETANSVNTTGVAAQPTSDYFVAEVNYFVLAGISYKPGQKPGIRLGISAALPENRGFFIASFQTNYIMNTIYGSSQNDWSVYGSVCFSSLSKGAI